MKFRFVPLIALAGVATLAVPYVGQDQAVAQTPHSVKAVQTGQDGLPPDAGDANWETAFIDGFNRPHVESTDSADNFSVYTIDGNPVWKNVGFKPIEGGQWKPRSISDCGKIENNVFTLYPFSNDDPSDKTKTKWRCRITSTQKFDKGTYIFAARLKVHTSTGHLSSFWLNKEYGREDLPQSEIDVIENTGQKATEDACKPDAVPGGRPNVVTNWSAKNRIYYGLNHSYYSSYTPKTGKKYCLPQADAGLVDDKFHTFHVEWVPNQSLKFYTDGKLSTTFSGNYAKGVSLNTILTNIDQNKAGQPAGNLEVNWVKVWHKKTPTPTPTPTTPPACNDNECFRANLGVNSYTYQPNSDTSDQRLARIVFDRRFYLDNYPDVLAWAQGKVASQGGTIYEHAQWHWLNYGVPQGRMGSATFDPKFYMANHPDVAAAYGATNYQGAISHYIVYGRGEGRQASPFFNAAYYKARYGDLSGMTNDVALDHFTNYGMNEGRQGSAQYAPAWYLGVNPDLRNAYGSNNYRRAMNHWINFGRGEGRPGAP